MITAAQARAMRESVIERETKIMNTHEVLKAIDEKIRENAHSILSSSIFGAATNIDSDLLVKKLGECGFDVEAYDEEGITEFTVCW